MKPDTVLSDGRAAGGDLPPATPEAALDALEVVAHAATQGEWFAVHQVVLVDAPGRGETDFPAIASAVEFENGDADAAHIAAFDPPTALKLIAVARAAREINRIHEWAVLAGGADGPLPQDVIQKFAEQQLPAMDELRRALRALAEPRAKR